MPDPKKVLTTIRRATELMRATPGRSGGIVTLETAAEVMVVGTCTAISRHSRRCWRSRPSSVNPGRHLILQELIHGPLMYPDDKGDRSHQLLDVFTALKCQYPERVHLILGNHELSELTGRSIGKDGEGLNAKFRRGVETAYGESAGEILESYKTLFAVAPPGGADAQSRLRLPHAPRRRSTSTRSTSSCSRPTSGRKTP